MKLKLFDTYDRETREFAPLNPDHVGLYCCGPTVYNFAHVGNLRTYLFEDILRRVLEFNGFNVKHIVNITDVGHLTSDADTGEDKMEVGARQSGMSAWDLAEKYTHAFQQDLERLNCESPHIWCKATDHIPEQISFIEELEAKGYTYKISDGIYFDSRKLNNYGHLARLDVQGLKAGARVEQGERRFVTDFALWKFSPRDAQRQMEWDSPWGRGFPGWHIECSAMSARYLGDYFDIHCGGEDHIPIHHTNEIAQTEAARGTRLANFWMHGYFLQLKDQKMAKSSGDFLTLERLIEEGFDPLVYRYFCLTAHYRSQLSFSWESLASARTTLNRLYQTAWDWGEPGKVSGEYLERFIIEINNDLNMPKALAVSWDLIRSGLQNDVKKATLLEFDRVFGLNIACWEPDILDLPLEIQNLLSEREAARKAKNWARSDELRELIAAAGYALEDTASGSRVKKINKRPGS